MSEGPNKRPPNPWMKNLGLWIVILLGLAVAVNVMQGTGSSRSGDTLAYSDFLARVDDGAVKSVEIRGEEIIGRTSGDEEFRTFNPGDTQLIERLRTKGVRGVSDEYSLAFLMKASGDDGDAATLEAISAVS